MSDRCIDPVTEEMSLVMKVRCSGDVPKGCSLVDSSTALVLEREVGSSTVVVSVGTVRSEPDMWDPWVSSMMLSTLHQVMSHMEKSCIEDSHKAIR